VVTVPSVPDVAFRAPNEGDLDTHDDEADRGVGDALFQLIADVEDPELPHVTIGDLGMVRSVVVDGSTATIELTPTYTGCPATEQIRDDVEAAARAAGYLPEVKMVMSPAWTTDWITPRGHERLHAAGIAPPPCVADTRPAGSAVAVSITPPCPRCGSRRTRVVTEFGSTACKSSHVCRDCAEPFDAFKAI
jgi:ring-1,2-phenylacetyl-CoA epoxidase subunit PaaD